MVAATKNCIACGIFSEIDGQTRIIIVDDNEIESNFLEKGIEYKGFYKRIFNMSFESSSVILSASDGHIIAERMTVKDVIINLYVDDDFEPSTIIFSIKYE